MHRLISVAAAAACMNEEYFKCNVCYFQTQKYGFNVIFPGSTKNHVCRMKEIQFYTKKEEEEGVLSFISLKNAILE